MQTAQERFDRGVQTLTNLPAGKAAWFWMTERGPDGLPFFLLTAQDRDSDGKALARRVGWVLDNTDKPGRAAQGIVRRLSSGRLTFSTAGSLDLAASIYSRLCLIAELPDVLMMAYEGRTMTASRMVENLSLTDAVLSGLSAGEKAWFCLVDRPQEARLVLDRSRENIQSRLGAGVGAKTTIRGQVRRSRSGALQLVVRTAAAGRTEKAMARWTRTTAAGWPALRALKSAAIITR